MKNSNVNSKEPDSLKIKPDRVIPTNYRWKFWRVNIFVYMCIGLLLFLGTCEGAQMSGWWATSGRTMPTSGTVTSSSADGTITSSSANPADIKGSMTIQAVLTAYNLTWEEMSKQFNIPPETPLDAQLKTLESVAPDFSVDQLRTWLTERAKK